MSARVVAAVSLLGGLALTACGGAARVPPIRNPLVPAPRAGSPLAGVWDLVSVTTRWPDGRVTEPWGAHPVGRLTYGADGRMTALLMDARRNQADGRTVAPEVQASVAGYYGTYTVDTTQRVVTHHVVASVRATESGAIERRYALRDGLLVVTAAATYEGAPVVHTLTWRRTSSP